MIYLVNSWDEYYPSPNNTKGVFNNYNAAVKFMEDLELNDKYKKDNYKIYELELIKEEE